MNYDLWCGPAPMTTRTRQKLHYDWHWQWDYGNGDLGNQGIHQMDVARWGLGVSDVGDSVLSYGGRFGYEDAGETANTQVCVHDYGDKTLVFEVRGLKTEELQGAKVGVIFDGSEGYVVMTAYDKGAAFDLNGKMVQAVRRAAATSCTSTTSSRRSAAATTRISTPTSRKATSPAPCATWATSATGSARR